jgi:soluble lytic murein transglycosylase-like protein
VEAGAAYLRELLIKYDGDPRRALAAYNAGPGAVDRYNGVPPYTETQTYVERVLRKYKSAGGE